METIKKEVWYGVIYNDKIVSTHDTRMSADIIVERLPGSTVERVRVTIDRIAS